MNLATESADMIRFADPSDESQMLAESAARFMAEHYSLPKRAEMLTRPVDELPAHWRNMAELGWLAAPLPQEVGGLGMHATDLLPLLRQMGAGLVLEPYGPAIFYCAVCLASARPSSRAEAVLAPMLEGKRLEILIDAADVQATRKGGDWHLQLSVSALLGAAAADVFWIIAAGPDGPMLFRLGKDGVRQRPMRLIDGQAAADVIVDCKVELIETEGLPQALVKAREASLFVVLAETDGLLAALFEDTLAYVAMREQFGGPIGKFQSLQHRLAEMFILREECLSMTQLAAEALEYPEPEYRRRVLSSARVKLADAAKLISREAVQLHGGMGVTDELAVGHRVKRLLVLAQQGGPRHRHLESLQD